MRYCVWLIGISVLVGSRGWAAEPEYRGKPLSHWQSKLKDKDGKVRVTAAEALGQTGLAARAAIPSLIELLSDKEWKVRHAAAEVLEKMGPEAKAAIPALTELLRDEKRIVRVAAAEALAKMGPEPKSTAISILIELLRDKTGEVPRPRVFSTHGFPEEQRLEWNARVRAAGALGKMGPEAKRAIPALTELLRDEEYDLRFSAASALKGIGMSAIPALMESLRDREWTARQASALALGMMGPEAKVAVPVLIELLRDKEENVRSFAAWALGKIGPEARTAIPVLIDLLRDKESNVRRNAAEDLGTNGSGGPGGDPGPDGIAPRSEGAGPLDRRQCPGQDGTRGQVRYP